MSAHPPSFRESSTKNGTLMFHKIDLGKAEEPATMNAEVSWSMLRQGFLHNRWACFLSREEVSSFCRLGFVDERLVAVQCRMLQMQMPRALVLVLVEPGS